MQQQPPYADVTKPLVNNESNNTNAGYSMAPTGYGAAPPPQMGGGVCSLHREDLDQYLSISGYGSNVAMFNCYFVREGPNTPPLCIACRRTIGDHSSRNAAPAPPMGLPVPTSGSPTGVAFGITIPSSNALPLYMTVGDVCDVVRVPFTMAARIALCIIAFVLVIQAAVFIATGLVSQTPVVIIGPCILLFVVLILGVAAKNYTITFYKGHGPLSRVDIMERSLFGCSASRSTTVGELGQIVCRPTNTRVNRQLIFEVVALAPTGQATPLFRGYHYECAPQFAAWQGYLMQYGIPPTGGMPTMLIY